MSSINSTAADPSVVGKARYVTLAESHELVSAAVSSIRF